jgi:hypothetical protein
MIVSLLHKMRLSARCEAGETNETLSPGQASHNKEDRLSQEHVLAKNTKLLLIRNAYLGRTAQPDYTGAHVFRKWDANVRQVPRSFALRTRSFCRARLRARKRLVIAKC